MNDSGRPRSGTSSSRSPSHPSRPASPQLNRSSSHIPDDHTGYQYEDGENKTKRKRTSDEELGSESSSEVQKEKDDVLGVENTPQFKDIRGGVLSEQDVEKALPAPGNNQSSLPPQDPDIVTWDSPDDPANPKNWSIARKWSAAVIVSAFTLLSPVASSMISPALASISKDFHITQELEATLTLSIFVLAYGIGPLFWGPLSEVYGRIIILQISNLAYIAWGLGCGFAQNTGQLIAFRFLSGLGGSAPLAIGGGVLSDCFDPEQRGKAIAIYSLAPLIGPAVGPIAGGFIAQNTTWRWCFYSTSIFAGVVQIIGMFLLQETYAPVLLARKRDRLRKETGNMALRTPYDSPDKTLSTLLQIAIQRPFRLLFTQPIVIVLACYMAYLYGLMYLMLTTFPLLWTDRYGESTGIGSLNFISMALGYTIGTQVCARMNDKIYIHLKKGNKGVGKPEYRVPMMIPASLMVPIGLFWYGWSAQAKTHWIVPNLGAVVYCAGTIMGFQCIQTYLVDSYTRYAASAIAAATMLRSMAGFGFPLFAPAMFARLDFGWGNSVLGFIALGIGIPAPFMLWKYGETLRKRSQFAAGA